MKRKINQILSILMTMALVLGLSVPVTAATELEPTEGVENPEVRAGNSKAIIVIPGIAGTELEIQSGVEAGVTAWFIIGNTYLTACNENGVSEYDIEPVASGLSKYGILNKYGDLCETLEDEFGDTYDVVFFPYDWRMSNSTTASKLATFIDDQGYNEVVLVAHSMGGLVASYYLRTAAHRNLVDKLITIGTPYLGSPKGVYVMETGKLVDGWTGIVANIGIKQVANNFPATYQLFPTERSFTNYIKRGSTTLSGYDSTTNFLKTLSWAKKSNGSVKTFFTTAENFHALLVSGSTHYTDLSSVDTYRVVGRNQDTISTVIYTANGEYDDIILTNSGDGTVTTKSARNNSTVKPIKYVSDEHLALVSNQDTIDYVVDVINGVSTYATTVDSMVNENDRGWLMGFDNKRITIQLSNLKDVNIMTGDGENIVWEDDILYLEENGQLSQIGTVWELGGGRQQFYLHDGEYIFEFNESPSDIVVEYSDSGYYEKVVSYENLGQTDGLVLQVADYVSKDIQVRERGIGQENAIASDNGTIEPTGEMSEEELLNYKNPNA